MRSLFISLPQDWHRRCSFAKKPQNNFKLSAKKEERLNGKINRLSALTF